MAAGGLGGFGQGGRRFSQAQSRTRVKSAPGEPSERSVSDSSLASPAYSRAVLAACT